MDNTEKNNLERLGFDIYPGCRNSAVEFAIDTWGISFDEIIAKFGDEEVLDAIYSCCEVGGILANLPDDLDNHEEYED